jgi:hypothetical protein
MKWFKKLIAEWARQGNNYEDDGMVISSKRLSTKSEDASPSDDPVLNFKVYSAVGGKLVEFRRYDRKNDRNDSTTYIITNDQDFGERIAKIATMENLKA